MEEYEMSYCIRGYHAPASFALEIVLAGIIADSEPLGYGKPSLFLRYFNIAISHEVIPKFQCSNYSYVKIFCIKFLFLNTCTKIF